MKSEAEYFQQRQQKQERFLPCLMTRLIDNNPQSRIDHQIQLYTIEQLKNNIFKNMGMILNSNSVFSAEHEDCPKIIQDSVLCFGLPNYVGCTKNEERIEEIR